MKQLYHNKVYSMNTVTLGYHCEVKYSYGEYWDSMAMDLITEINIKLQTKCGVNIIDMLKMEWHFITQTVWNLKLMNCFFLKLTI